MQSPGGTRARPKTERADGHPRDGAILVATDRAASQRLGRDADELPDRRLQRDALHAPALFLSNVLGAQTGVIGLIERVAETTASLPKIASGAIFGPDRAAEVACGRRRRDISTASKPLLLAAGSWGWVFWSRFGDRTGKGLRTAASDALVADSIDVARRGLAFGIHRAGNTGGSSTSQSLCLDGKLPEISLLDLGPFARYTPDLEARRAA